MNRNEQATGGRRSRDEKGKTEVRKNRFENTWSLLRALAAPPASGAMLLLEPGTRIAGRYEIVGTIGKGGMGTVYCARDSSLDRKVAIKFQRPVSGEQDTFGGSAEATSLARLSHPNVVTVHETGRFEQHTYIVMEYVDGMTLAEWLRHGKRSLAEVVDMFLQAGRGLQAVHSAGLVHLDFKPANVLIGKNGIAKVVDFGLSLKSDTRGIGRAPASSSTDGAQVLGRIFGTPAYMAPEQILGEQVDARTDQFAFCVALFEAVHGRRPFEADTLEELLYEITRGRVNKAQGRKVPSWLNGILDRGLSADPAERFPDMKTLVAELERGPRAARRKILAAAASVVLAAGMAAGAALHSAGKPDPCGQAPSDMAAVWNARARDEIKKNIKAGGEPGWEKTYGMVKSRLDGFGKKWQRIYRSSCEATKVYHAQSEQALELTAGCLRGKLGEFAEMVDVLQSSPGLDFRKVSDMTGVLPDPSECARTGQLRRLQALPADRAERKAIAAASKAIYRAWLLARSGRLDEARKILDSQSHEGFHGHLPLQARWTYVRAEVARAASRSSDAERFLRDAVALAAASGDDELLSKSMSDLAFVISNPRAGDGEIDTLLGAAGAVAARTKAGLPLKRKLLGNEAYVRTRQGRYDAAVEAARKALAITRSTGDRVAVSRAMNTLGMALLRDGKYGKGLKVLEEAAALARKTAGEFHPAHFNALQNLAVAARNAGDYESAIRYTKEAARICGKTFGADSPKLPALWNNLGVMLMEQGKEEMARRYFERTLDRERKLHGNRSQQVGFSLGNLAIILVEGKHYELARQYAVRSRDVLEAALGSKHPVMINAHSILGTIERYCGHLEGSERSLRRALVLANEVLPANHPGLVNPRVELARTELALGKKRMALGHVSEALELARKIELPQNILPDVWFAAAEILWETKNRRREAIEYARKAEARWKELGMKTESAKAEAWLKARARART